jgi:hypothetical protein
MKLQEAKTEVLRHLFECYKESPTGIFDVSDVIKATGQNPYEFGKYLVSNGLVKNHQYRATQFVCQISSEGIDDIAPEYFKEKTDKVISVLGLGSGNSIMEILDLEPKQFQAGFDVVKYLERTGFIKKGDYRHNDILIEMSLEGREYYENNKADFVP